MSSMTSPMSKLLFRKGDKYKNFSGGMQQGSRPNVFCHNICLLVATLDRIPPVELWIFSFEGRLIACELQRNSCIWGFETGSLTNSSLRDKPVLYRDS
ncbi:hypothetical protein CEXT_56311 [Caerostris extrusa]|uniref:Uncharacterized protein n=1 Tax=Caerostris extrusa TaxID=172846 RepID=A0AAV4T2H1_CAEEX|nr:hypothetical protein CEXT_56311 [Caerostris extrusa]